MIAIGAISTAITVLGAIHNNIPAWSTYLETNAIPTVITILDWVGARIKDAKGINSISIGDITTILAEIKSLKDGIPPIAPAPTKTG